MQQSLQLEGLTAQHVASIAEEFGTPLYLYDGEILKANYHRLKRCLPTQVDVFYALKVNPNISLCSLLLREGANAEVCSLNELEIAIKAGFLPSNIIFLGPSKRREEIERALELDIFALVVESREELHRVSEIAGKRGKTANIAIRVNPNFAASSAPLKMGGRPTQFGISQDEFVLDFVELIRTPNVHVRGIHVYNGSRILDAQTIYENTKNILSLFKEVSNQYHYRFDMIDVGGGMGVPYFGNEQPLDAVEMERLIKPLFNEFHNAYPNVRIIMESGRYIAATSAVFITCVNNLKESRGKTFAICDGGTNCHLSAVGLDSVIKRNFPMFNLSNPNGEEKQNYQIAGPLCNPDDLLARNIDLPTIKVGDLLAVAASGAYGPTASPVLFHSQGYPAEVLVEGSQAYLVRKRDYAEDIISRHVFVDFCLLSKPSDLGSSPESSSTFSSVLHNVVNALRKVLDLPNDRAIALDSRLRDHLGLDSLSAVEFLMAVEDSIATFKVNSNTLEPRHFKDVQTIVEYIVSEMVDDNFFVEADVPHSKKNVMSVSLKMALADGSTVSV